MNRKSGFTLIELLFAIFIFSIVISAVYGAYSTTFHTIQGSEAILEESHQARAAFERMTEDLTTIVAGSGGYLLGVEQEIEGGRADNMTFVSSTHISLGAQESLMGDSVIRFSTDLDETNGTLKLLRSDTVKKPGDEVEAASETQYLLCQGLRQVRFTYFNEDGLENTEWKTESEQEADGTITQPELPVMISIELIFPNTSGDENGSVFKTAIALPRSFKE